MIQTSTASPFDAKADEIQDKEAIRKEIRNMRHTRDSLVQQRQELDERQHRVRCVIAASVRYVHKPLNIPF